LDDSVTGDAELCLAFQPARQTGRDEGGAAGRRGTMPAADEGGGELLGRIS
jgi:hypothetical protein